MPTIVTCPDETCGRQLRVPDELLGKSVKCPKCGKIFTAREDTGAAAPPAPPPRPVEEEEEREEEERRPQRRPVTRDDRDDDDDDRPRRRRRSRRDYAPHRGTMILVFGILSVVGIVSFVFGPIAWIMGNQDLQEMRAGRMDPEGEGSTNAGRICGIIGTILSIIGLVCCVLYFLLVAGIVAGAGGGRFR